jgi:acyl-coenzyme A synthetase/AMP-(fatty) acid ligase
LPKSRCDRRLGSLPSLRGPGGSRSLWGEAAWHRCAEHAGVAAACVVGIPDEAQGERVKAFVVPKPSHLGDPRLADELIAHCRERLIKWSCPREIELRDELTLTRVGKVDFTALIRDEVARLPSAARG